MMQATKNKRLPHFTGFRLQATTTYQHRHTFRSKYSGREQTKKFVLSPLSSAPTAHHIGYRLPYHNNINMVIISRTGCHHPPKIVYRDPAFQLSTFNISLRQCPRAALSLLHRLAQLAIFPPIYLLQRLAQLNSHQSSYHCDGDPGCFYFLQMVTVSSGRGNSPKRSPTCSDPSVSSASCAPSTLFGSRDTASAR